MRLNLIINKQIAKLLLVLIAIFLPLQNGRAEHARVLTSDIEFSCDQTENNKAIQCAYRFIEPEITKRISATLDTTELPIQDIRTYPFEDSTTSILFLVDTSKSEKPEQFQQIHSQIIALAQQALSYQQIGLATFDASLKVLEPVGGDPEEIIQVVDNIIETEQPTELYRNILDSLELLKTSLADRKALYVFSSGKSDDQAIYHSDVIKAAKAADIKIISIAYPVASTPVDTTQTLRRLSKESGGAFIKASENDFELPESLMSDPYAAIDNGGILSIDLTPVLSGDFRGLQVARLIFETNSKRITVKLPLELSASNDSTSAQLKDKGSAVIDSPGSENKDAKEHSPKNVVVAESANSKVISDQDRETAASSSSLLDYWPVIPAGLLLLGLAAYFLSSNKKQVKTTNQEDDDGKPLAYLVSLTDESLIYAIEHSPWKVGRTRENNLFLEHSSVSRKHCEFKQNRDGSFTVIDLDSLNGVYVNNTKVSTGLIKDGDKVDIGDLRLKFVMEIGES